MNVLDLFSGIGGFSIGLEKAGMKTVLFCEQDEECKEILKERWPGIPIWDDVETLNKEKIEKLCGEVSVISGGFPCQDISIGGKRKGIGGSRSSLWKEYWRLINEVKPRYAIIENVERLRKDGLGVVLRDLHKIGYNAEWHCIRARAVGHLHQRDRIWIIAYRSEQRSYECNGEERHLQINKNRKSKKILQERKECQLEPGEICTILSRRALESIKDAYSSELSIVSEIRRVTDGIAYQMDFDTKTRKTDSERLKEIRAIVKRIEYRRTESIKQVGNAVVPQIPELIGKAIVDYENNKRIQE